MSHETLTPPTTTEILPTIIGPSEGWMPLHLGELWQYRELVFFLAWRDISIRYKQTVLGIAWAIIQPFFSMVIFSIFFGAFAHIPSEGVPYPIFTFAALLPWQYFSTALTEASQSLISNERLITKTYFPRLIIPLASVVPGIVDFGFAFVVLLAMMVFYHVTINATIILLPLLLLIAIATALGVGLWISALNVQYRDFRYIVPFLAQAWMFASPVTYPVSIVPDQWRLLYSLNPMVGVIEGFRLAILGTQTVTAGMIILSLIGSVALVISGLFYFRRVEDSFADVV